ncbi:hypothetical protein HanRHA438_Chr14g0657751 [Helianthus annuus]|nr:hypothetical protein HanIR_Chr14g0701871 [Helianthus annuus]KAJ0854008.1 hypothetical protein HanRHA438_Chr14g0657751 [Helianthus annuus]
MTAVEDGDEATTKAGDIFCVFLELKAVDDGVGLRRCTMAVDDDGGRWWLMTVVYDGDEATTNAVDEEATVPALQSSE